MTVLGERCTEGQQGRVGVLQAKVALLADSAADRRKTLNWLQQRLDWRARIVQDLNRLRFEETGLICQLTWQSWENLLWTLSCSEDKALTKVVSNPQVLEGEPPHHSLRLLRCCPCLPRRGHW